MSQYNDFNYKIATIFTFIYSKCINKALIFSPKLLRLRNFERNLILQWLQKLSYNLYIVVFNTETKNYYNRAFYFLQTN